MAITTGTDPKHSTPNFNNGLAVGRSADPQPHAPMKYYSPPISVWHIIFEFETNNNIYAAVEAMPAENMFYQTAQTTMLPDFYSLSKMPWEDLRRKLNSIAKEYTTHFPLQSIHLKQKPIRGGEMILLMTIRFIQTQGNQVSMLWNAANLLNQNIPLHRPKFLFLKQYTNLSQLKSQLDIRDPHLRQTKSYEILDSYLNQHERDSEWTDISRSLARWQ